MLLEGVVIAPRLGIAYVMRPAGGIDAVSLASGAVRWRSDKASKPLALAGDRLIAQAESRGARDLHLVALDARSGASRDSVRIPLPDGVSATVTDTPSGSFRVRAEAVGAGLAVYWEATGVGTFAQGILPEVEGQTLAASDRQALNVASGAALLDLSPLRVKDEPSVRLAQSTALAHSTMEELSAPAVKGPGGRQLLSADGRHVLVTEPMEASGSTLERHRWTVYERVGGSRLGAARAMVSASPFVVVDRTLFQMVPAHAFQRDGKLVERPLSLRAVDLKTGAEAWTKAAGDTAFRGPFPP